MHLSPYFSGDSANLELAANVIFPDNALMIETADIRLVVDNDAPLRLADAIEIAFPRGGITVSGLRKEAAKGRLIIERIAGKDFVTLAAINAMMKLRGVKRPKSRIYFIRCKGFVKIGRSDDPEARLLAMRTGNPLDLELLRTVPGGASEERHFHKKFRDQHHRFEWFRYAGALRAWLEPGYAAARGIAA